MDSDFYDRYKVSIVSFVLPHSFVIYYKQGRDCRWKTIICKGGKKTIQRQSEGLNALKEHWPPLNGHSSTFMPKRAFCNNYLILQNFHNTSGDVHQNQHKKYQIFPFESAKQTIFPLHLHIDLIFVLSH